MTDIEGSTRLWEAHPTAMRAALIRHDRLIERCVAEHGGVVVRPRGEGDSRFAVFSHASAALAAACAAQRALHAEAWPPGVPIRVRIALHTGEADVRDGDYYGSAVNRCARVRGLGSGGQTLVTGVTAALVGSLLPAGARLAEVGLFHLRDLSEPVPVFQLLHPDVPAGPPIKPTPPTPSHNLPIQPTTFVGREHELIDIMQRLTRTRLLTLTGSGGIGKTRLALRAAEHELGNYADGVWLAELGTLADPALVPNVVALALGVDVYPGQGASSAIVDRLRSARALLILDNCEGVIDACAQLAESLLRRCSSVRLLATSQEPLNIAGESVWRVPPLGGMPKPAALPEGTPRMSDDVLLFLDRARLVDPGFALTEQSRAQVAHICRELEGIPLAIELAAARMRVLPVGEVAARIHDRLRVLVGGRRTAPRRQQTLREALQWSFDLLTPSEQRLLSDLAVFAGGWTLDAATAVLADDDFTAEDVLDHLSGLVDKSLVVVDEGRTRYRLLETVRQFAHERLRDRGRLAAVQERHALFLVTLAEQADAELGGTNQRSWLSRLQLEHDNLRAGLRWTLDSGRADLALRLVGALGQFWSILGLLDEGQQWLGEVLERVPGAEAALGSSKTKVLHGAGVLARLRGDYASSEMFHTRALELARTLGDQPRVAVALDNLGTLARLRGRYALARGLHQQALAFHRDMGNRRGAAIVLNNLGILARLEGDFAQARRLHEQVLALERQLGNTRGVALALNNLGTLQRQLGQYAAAERLHQQALTLERELTHPQGVAVALGSLGTVWRLQGRYEAAAEAYRQALAIMREIGDAQGVAIALSNLGTVAGMLGDYTSAEASHLEALALKRRIGDRRGCAITLGSLAAIAHQQNDHARAARLYREGVALMRELHDERGVARYLGELKRLRGARRRREER